MNNLQSRNEAPTRSLRAVCVDALEQNRVSTPWGPKNLVKVVFETEELKANGYPVTVTRTYNISYYEKALLRQVLEAWLGRSLSASEMLNGFPFESLVGTPAEIEVRNAVREDGARFLDLVSVRPCTIRAIQLKPSGSYRRWEGTGTASPANRTVNSDTTPVTESR